MKTLCKEYKALPQASTRSFTSKFKDGTLPLQAYETLENSENEDSTDKEDEADLQIEDDYIDENP